MTPLQKKIQPKYAAVQMVYALKHCMHAPSLVAPHTCDYFDKYFENLVNWILFLKILIILNKNSQEHYVNMIK